MIKILVVEDDKELNEIVTSYIKKEGYVVESVFNGLDALNKIYENK